uniref:Uncharacterized protein n=1 Tax=Romanomermis culicivorax TaxID=13658 RepID=A0A915JC44_ROMCU
MRDDLDIFLRQRVSENITSGTQLELHGFVAHYRKTKERPRNLTFKILHESDKERHFDIGQQDGVLRVAKALDREKIAEYKLVIEARDLGGNSGNTSAVIEVLDVNDNAPVLHPVNGFTVDENGKVPLFVGIITATDADGPGNRDPFLMEYVSKGPLSDAFELTFDQNLDNGWGGMKIVATKPLDREGPYGKEIFLPIKVSDSGSPRMSALRNFRIEIGDVNDNPMTDGQSVIYVYDYEGHLSTTIIGRAFVEDLDDWDYEDKIFTMVSGHTSFSVETNGLIVMHAGTEPGVYNIMVSVNDRRRGEHASANVTVILERLKDDAVQNSGSFIIKGMNPEEFLASKRVPRDSSSPYQSLRRYLAFLLDVPEDRVQIFSVKSYWPDDYDAQMFNEKFTEVHFAAYNSPYMSSVYLNGILQMTRNALEKQLDPQGAVRIVQINIDPCADEKYCPTGGCVKRFRIEKDPILINSNRTSLLGINLTVDAQCSCPQPSVPQRCVREACGNGGICHNVKKSNQTIGFFCECRASGRGPRCEGRSRSFGPEGYIWLKPIVSCDNFTISFEFATRSSNAVLLYNGPMTAQEPHKINSIDLILVQIIAGHLTVHVNLGSGMKKFQLNNTQAPTVNDGDWHTVHIFLQRGARVVTVLLDKCQQDTKQCQVSGPTYGSNEQINVDTPLQLGGVAKVDGTAAPIENSESLDGCIRNLYIGGELYDLINVLKSENSEPGCKHTESYCDTNAFQGPRFNSLCHEGECVASFNGDARCVCDVGWTGDRCEKQSYWKTFKKGAYVNYSLKKLDLLSKSWTKIRLMFVRGDDEDSDDGQLFRIQDAQGTKSSIINLLAGRVGYEFSTSTPGESVSVDGSPDARFAAHRLPEEYHIYAVSNVQNSFVDYDPHKFLLGHGSNIKSGQIGVRNDEEFNGCFRELVFNDNHFEIGESNHIAHAQSEHNVEDGCKFISSCKSGLVACRYPMICQDFWKGGFCTCPSNAKPIWHRSGDGTLEGCQESTAALRLGITNGAVAAILISLLTLIVLVLILVVYSRRRRKPPSIQEDLISRENVRGYNEEGGGEEDQYNYNIGPLRKPVLPTEDWPQGTPIVSDSGRPKPKHRRPEGDLDTFIRDRLRDARRDPMAPPFDELRSYGVEKDNLDRISLSSLSTDGESDIDQETVRSWGPKFSRIADAYGHN